MTKSEAKPTIGAVNELFSKSPDGLREIVRAVMQEMLEGEMTEAVGAAKSERSDGRLGYRSGYYKRTLITRVGKLELRVPQDRDGRFSTELFERYQRSEQAFVATLAEMYVQGVSTRKVKAITEELCGHSFSASTISAINKRLDESLTAFASRRLDEPFAYLIIDAHYEKVRQAGVVSPGGAGRYGGRLGRPAADPRGRARQPRKPLVVEGFPPRPQRRGLTGVEYIVADDHAGLAQPFVRCCPIAFQRCYVHFLRNALDHLPRKADDDCLQELRWIYDRRAMAEASQDLAAWMTKWAPDTRSSSVGWRRPSRRPSPSTGFRGSIISIS